MEAAFVRGKGLVLAKPLVVESRVNRLDLVMLYFILSNLFFIRYLKFVFTPLNSLTFSIIDAAIVGYIAFRLLSAKFRIGPLLYLSVLFVAVVLQMNIYKFGYSKVALENIISIFSPATIIVFFIYLRKQYSIEVLGNIANQIRKFLNVYFIGNSIIIYFQITTGTFLMERFFSINPHAFDHMDGLIGVNGVSVLNFVWIATLLFNLNHYLARKKVITLFSILVQFIVMNWISLFNDNKMFLITTFTSLLIFFVLTNIRNRFSAGSIFKTVAALVVIFGLLYAFSSSSETDPTDSNLSSKLLGDFFYSKSDMPDADNERAYINYLAFRYYHADAMGIGLKNVDLNDQSIHKHLGINSSSLLLIQGGMVFLIAAICFYTAIILKLFDIRKGRRFDGVVIYVLIAFSVIVNSFASQMFKDHYLVIALALVYFALYLTSKSPKTE